MSRIITLTQGLSTIVDDADYDRLAPFPWCAAADHAGNFYAVHNAPRAGGGYRTIRMHRLIMDAPPGVQVDHQDGNGLNNRRVTNLRFATHGQNQCNRRGWAANGYRGVVAAGSRWRARIYVAGRCVDLGCFPEPADAARAYDVAAIGLHGEFANLNFPAVALAA